MVRRTGVGPRGGGCIGRATEEKRTQSVLYALSCSSKHNFHLVECVFWGTFQDFIRKFLQFGSFDLNFVCLEPQFCVPGRVKEKFTSVLITKQKHCNRHSAASDEKAIQKVKCISGRKNLCMPGRLFAAGTLLAAGAELQSFLYLFASDDSLETLWRALHARKTEEFCFYRKFLFLCVKKRFLLKRKTDNLGFSDFLLNQSLIHHKTRSV